MTADVHTLLGAYVLDAVDDLERAAFARHMTECAECRAEVDELIEISARLADGAWSVPPPRLRDNVLAEITNTRQLPPPVPPPARVVPGRAPAPRRLRLVAAAAVLVTAMGAGAASYFVQDQRVRDAEARAEAAQASEARVRSILAAPDVVLKEQPLNSGGRVTVASSQLQNAGVILLAANSAPDPGQVYQLWTISGSTPTSVGALGTGQSAAVQLVEGLPGASAVGITLEPAPGSTSPTMPLDAAVTLT